MFSSSIHKSPAHWALFAAAALVLLPTAFAIPGSNTSESGAYLGVTIGDLTTAQATALKLHDTNGVVVQSLDHDGPACKAGIQPNDVIVSINGNRVFNVQQMAQLIQGMAAGSVTTVGIVRDGKAQNLKATLSSRKSWLEPKAAPPTSNAEVKTPTLPPVPYSTDMDVAMVTPASARRGIVVESLTPQLAEYFGVPAGQGVLVRNVQKGSLGAAAGLKAGDVITKIGGQQIRDLADWRRSMTISSGKTALSIIRDKREQVVEMVFPGPAGNLRLGEDRDHFGRDMDAFNQQWEQLGPEIQKQTEQAMMLHSDELQKMQRQIQESIRKNVNPQLKIQAGEIEKQMKQLQPEIDKQTAEMQKQMEQMRPEIQKQMKDAQEQMKQLGPELQKQMEEMQKSMAVLKQQDFARMREQIQESMKNLTPQIQEQLKLVTPQIQQQMKELQKEMQQHQKEWQDMMKSWPNSSDRPNEM